MSENQCVTINEDILYIYFKSLRDILHNLGIIKQKIAYGTVNKVIFISDFPLHAECCCSISERNFIIQFLNQIDVLTFAILGQNSFSEVMDIMLFCDINLCVDNFIVNIDKYQCEGLFSFEQQLEFRTGSNSMHFLKKKLCGYLDAEQMLELKLVNSVFDKNKVEEELHLYLDKLFKGKSKRQIDFIISNHKSFRNMSLSLTNDFLAFNEANYFCMLVADTYMFQ